MTREEKALIYFKALRQRKAKDYSSVLKVAPKGSVAYEAVAAEIEVYDMAIKALEQGSVLDKIRDEIEKIARPNEIGGRGYKESIRYGLCIALEIINKYRTESEDI